jgi:hypothetical protein
MSLALFPHALSRHPPSPYPSDIQCAGDILSRVTLHHQQVSPLPFCHPASVVKLEAASRGCRGASKGFEGRQPATLNI